MAVGFKLKGKDLDTLLEPFFEEYSQQSINDLTLYNTKGVSLNKAFAGYHGVGTTGNGITNILFDTNNQEPCFIKKGYHPTTHNNFHSILAPGSYLINRTSSSIRFKNEDTQEEIVFQGTTFRNKMVPYLIGLVFCAAGEAGISNTSSTKRTKKGSKDILDEKGNVIDTITYYKVITTYQRGIGGTGSSIVNCILNLTKGTFRLTLGEGTSEQDNTNGQSTITCLNDNSQITISCPSENKKSNITKKVDTSYGVMSYGVSTGLFGGNAEELSRASMSFHVGFTSENTKKFTSMREASFEGEYHMEGSTSDLSNEYHYYNEGCYSCGGSSLGDGATNTKKAGYGGGGSSLFLEGGDGAALFYY